MNLLIITCITKSRRLKGGESYCDIIEKQKFIKILVRMPLVYGYFEEHCGSLMRWNSEILCELKAWLELTQGRFVRLVPLFAVLSLDVLSYRRTVSCNSGRFVVTLKL
jgi:hypothetical protein